MEFKQEKKNNQVKVRVALLSVCSNTSLVIGKLAVGTLVGSVSIISEAIHSCMDLLAAAIAFFAIKTSDTPPDQEHPYGHGKIENVASGIEALLILSAGAWIIYESVKKIIHPEPMKMVWLGVGVMFFSSAVNLFVSKKLFKTGEETNSPALLADGWHLLTDVWTSAGVMLGLLLIAIAQLFFPEKNFYLLDPFIGIAVALIIINTALKLIRESTNALMDIRLPEAEEKTVYEHLKKLKPITRGFHKLRTRRVGNRRFIEFHLKVDGSMSVEEAHQLNHRIENSIEKHLKNSSVIIHYEPCSNCDDNCIENCFLEPEEREQVFPPSRRKKRLLD